MNVVKVEYGRNNLPPRFVGYFLNKEIFMKSLAMSFDGRDVELIENDEKSVTAIEYGEVYCNYFITPISIIKKAEPL